MLSCCNHYFNGSFSRVILNTSSNYYKVEFGTCPICNVVKFKEYKQYFDGTDSLKEYSGVIAEAKLRALIKRLEDMPCGSWTKQNLWYGDFMKTNRTDAQGNPIYLQLRRNFNGQYEVLNEIYTTTTRETNNEGI